ncbi:MAG: carbohydrate-binding domain-containing protein [Oscillospiraceae bacterium]|nr:carbohydrate-binding domain-containing protein [Oscillospiraceae bacterium]
MKRICTVIFSLIMVCSALSGCSESSSVISQTSNSSKAEVSDSSDIVSTPDDVDIITTDAEMFTERDKNSDYDEKECVRIELSGNTAKSDSDCVSISESTVTITKEGSYIISGSLEDGMIIVDAEDSAKIQLILSGADIQSNTSAALYIRNADKVFVTLADGTSNSLSNGGVFNPIDENSIDSAVFSKEDLTFNGSGNLTVTSPTAHAIVCKDDLVITGGKYTLECASHGVDANDSVRISDTVELDITSGKDGIHCENSDEASLGFVYISNGMINIDAQGDGISAGAYMLIENGSFDILSGGGSVNGSKESSDNYGGFGGGPGGKRPGDEQVSQTEQDSTSMKAIKATDSIIINGGTFSIDSADDSIHSDKSVTIASGTFEIASGDDAIHAEETLDVSGGKIEITKSYEGLEALNINITNGDISLIARDDGLNAAGGTDSSGINGGRDGMFGGPGGGHGGMGGPMSSGNGSIIISGGTLYIQASGDGIDANGTLEITGGYTVVCGPSQGDTATLDYDVSGVITGGTFIGTGGAGMAQTFSSSSQGVVAIRTSNQTADSEVTLKDKNGDTILSCTPKLPFAVVILSSPDIISGETYTVSVGTDSGEVVAS